MVPKKGEGAFQWNAGGWFGGQLGGTLWMLLIGVFLLSKDGVAAGVSLAGFVLPNILGVGLWTRRDSIAPYPAVMGLMVFIGACAAATVFAINTRGPAWSASGVSYWMLIVFPLVLGQFYFLETTTRKRLQEKD